MVATVVTQEVGKTSPTAVEAEASPVELCRKLAAPLVATRDPRGADGSHEDEKRLRADSPAIFDYMFMYCKSMGSKSDRKVTSDKGQGATNQGKMVTHERSRQR
jgi:hypothetical protein